MFIQITESHTSRHGLTLAKYRELYPDNPISSKEFLQYLSQRTIKQWNDNREEYTELRRQVGLRLRGENHPLWKGGYAAGVRGGAPKSKARRRAIRFYGHQCMVPECDFNIVVENHHITPRHEGGSHGLENCILLCPNHHALADLEILTREYLYSIVHTRLNETTNE